MGIPGGATQSDDPFPESMPSVPAAFQAVGTSRPVTFFREEKGYLLRFIEDWVTKLPGASMTCRPESTR